MNRLAIEKRAQIINALVEGNSIRATCRLTGACKDAVLKLIRDMGAACATHHYATVRAVQIRRVQCDERQKRRENFKTAHYLRSEGNQYTTKHTKAHEGNPATGPS